MSRQDRPRRLGRRAPAQSGEADGRRSTRPCSRATASSAFSIASAQSDVRDRFVLKGAMLLRALVGSALPRDARSGPAAPGRRRVRAIRDDLRAICATSRWRRTPSTSTPTRIRIEAIRAEDEYAGTRATLPRALRQGAPHAADRHGARRRGLARAAGRARIRRCSTFPRPRCSPIRARPWSRRSSKRWSCSATATAASRTSSICTTWRAASSSTVRRWRRPSRRTFERRRTPDPGGGADRAHAGLLGESVAAGAGARFRPAGGTRSSGAAGRRVHSSAARPFFPIAGRCALGARREGTWHRGGPWSPERRPGSRRRERGEAYERAEAAVQAVPGLQGLRRRVAGGDSGALGGERLKLADESARQRCWSAERGPGVSVSTSERRLQWDAT